MEESQSDTSMAGATMPSSGTTLGGGEGASLGTDTGGSAVGASLGAVPRASSSGNNGRMASSGRSAPPGRMPASAQGDACRLDDRYGAATSGDPRTMGHPDPAGFDLYTPVYI